MKNQSQFKLVLMKKSLVILFALSLTFGSSHAQNSVPLPIMSSLLKDSSIMANIRNEEIAYENAYIPIQAIDHRSELVFGFKGGLNRSDVSNGGEQFKADALMGWVAG